MSSAFAIAGFGFLAVAIAGSVGLVTSVLYGTPAAAIGAGCVAGLLVALWFVVPAGFRLARRA